MGQRRSISGSRILITGASQGIGKALAEASAARGAQVLAVARSEDQLQELAGKIRAQGATGHLRGNGKRAIGRFPPRG